MDFIKEHLDILEYIVLVCIAFFQIKYFVNILTKIKEYSSTFKSGYLIGKPSDIEIDEDESDEELTEEAEGIKEVARTSVWIDSSSKGFYFNKIIKNINSYLAKNSGAIIDFHILKDITDRTIDTVEEEISNKIPAPLYMGLAATMVGIIIGLWGLDFSQAKITTAAVTPLISGIKWAMTVSVMGLALTTWLSIIEFKNGKKKVEEDKNDFLSFLQTELLPDLYRSEVVGVRALNNKLDHFSRASYGMVNNLEQIVEKTTDTLEKEHQLLIDLKEIDVRKMSETSLRIFSELLPLMDSFQAFPQYYHELNSSLSSTAEVTNKLKEFIARTENVNAILSDIKKAVNDSGEATSFFNKHIKSFMDYEAAVNQSIVNADSKMQDALNELRKAVTGQFDSYTELITNYSSKMDSAFEKSIEKYINIADQQIIRIKDAFKDTAPKFEKLNKLDKLDDLSTIIAHLKNLEETQKKQIEAILSLRLKVDGNSIQLPESILLKQPASKMDKILNTLFITAYVALISVGIYSLWTWISSNGFF